MLCVSSSQLCYCLLWGQRVPRRDSNLQSFYPVELGRRSSSTPSKEGCGYYQVYSGRICSIIFVVRFDVRLGDVFL